MAEKQLLAHDGKAAPEKVAHEREDHAGHEHGKKGGKRAETEEGNGMPHALSPMRRMARLTAALTTMSTSPAMNSES